MAQDEWWHEISVTVKAEAADAAAELLREAGASNGVELEEQKDAVRLTAYYPPDEHLRARVEQIKSGLKLLEQRTGLCVKRALEQRDVSAAGWKDQWKKYFHVTHLPGRWVIRPEWENYTARSGEVVLSLDPDAAFGTGTHPTTSLCLQALEELLTPQALARRPQIFDVGTGSGVLAIAAAKLGAEKIAAVDIDPLAVRIAQHNLELNGISPAQVELSTGDLLTGVTGEADLVIANLLAWIIERLLPDLPRRMKPGAELLAGGITDEQAPGIIAAAAGQGLEPVKAWHDSGWTALSFKRVR